MSPSLLLECDRIGQVGKHKDPFNLCFEGGDVILLKKVIAASPQIQEKATLSGGLIIEKQMPSVMGKGNAKRAPPYLPSCTWCIRWRALPCRQP